MHMADALISPAVGVTMWAASAGVIGYCSKKIKVDFDEHKIPLMGVLGAFIFAAQMINFTIPATGSSGHIGGGMILAILLGPYAAFLTMASILTIQSLFFADGGLLALGCNIFNLGFFPCFIAYPYIYRKIVGDQPSQKRIIIGATLATVAGMQLGAFGVVLQTVTSGVVDLPFNTFLLLMQPIHLAIGIIEGFVTVGVVTFVLKSRPEIIENTSDSVALEGIPIKKVAVTLFISALIIGGALSWFASTHPDGLEWAIFHTTGKEELSAPDKGIHTSLAQIQEKTVLLPDYGFEEGEEETAAAESWPGIEGGTSIAGIVGSGLTLIMALLIGFVFKKRKTAN